MLEPQVFAVVRDPHPSLEGHVFPNPVDPTGQTFMLMLVYKNASRTREGAPGAPPSSPTPGRAHSGRAVPARGLIPQLLCMTSEVFFLSVCPSLLEDSPDCAPGACVVRS